MTSKGSNRSNPSTQRPAYRSGNKSLYRAGTQGSGNRMPPIMIWTLAFVAVAAIVVVSAVYLTQPQPQQTNSAGLNVPIVVTPANITSSGRTLGNPNARGFERSDLVRVVRKQPHGADAALVDASDDHAQAIEQEAVHVGQLSDAHR